MRRAGGRPAIDAGRSVVLPGRANSPIARTRRVDAPGFSRHSPLSDGSAMLDKTYRPAEVEARHDRLWEAGGYFRPAADPAARALLHRHAAAERHRQPAHGPCARQHGAGHAGALLAHARPRGALAAGHGPRRHRDPDGGRAPARAARASAAASSAARPSSSGSGRGRRNPAARSAASSIASAPRPTGRASASPSTRASRRRSARCSSTSTARA